MVISRVIRDSAVAALLLGVFSWLNIAWVKENISKLERASFQRLASSHAAAINRTHLENDDLSLIRTLEPLRKAPGVVNAYIVEPNVRVRATSTYRFPLKHEGHTWGHLILVGSERAMRRMIWKHGMMLLAVSAFILGIFAFYVKRLEGRKTLLQAKILEFEANLATEIRKRKVAEEREQKLAMQAEVGIRQAVERIADPLLALDGQQRLVALNPAAIKVLQMPSSDPWLQKSWHEIPVLSSCGKALELSVASPLKPIEWSDPDRPYKLHFKTDSQGWGGTWIGISVE